MSKQSPSAVLGIYVTRNLIEAVLLREVGEGAQAVRRFVRQRQAKQELSNVASMALALPGLKGTDDSDYTLQVGAGNGRSVTSDLLLDRDLAGLVGKKEGAGASGQTAHQAVPFAAQLKDLLAECSSLGIADPRLAFCVSAPDVSYAEVIASPEDKKQKRQPLSFGRKGKGGPLDRRDLIELVGAQREGPFDRSRVGFISMSPLQSRPRYLAVVAEPTEPVKPTLGALAAQHKGQAPNAAALDTEVSCYVALAKHVLDEDEQQTTTLVRVGTEDTLILFFAGRELRHYDRLRSLTSFDAPQTVCSRVLLHQDEQKIGQVHRVILHGEGRLEPLQESFKTFFSSARVESVHEILASAGLRAASEGEGSLTPGTIPAAVVALRVLKNWDKGEGYVGIDLLPKELLQARKKQDSLFAWHTALAMVLLFSATLVTVWRYLDQQAEIKRQRMELLMNPVQMPVQNPELLRARVDSLKAAYNRHTNALRVLDSLLIGSDKWSRSLETASNATGAIQGIWYSSWTPSATELRVEGAALSRTKVAQIARRLGARIDGLDYEDVNDIRIYSYVMTMPLRNETPRVAIYLQDVAAGTISEAAEGDLLYDASDEIHGVGN